MRITIVSDVHSNLAALEAVLRHAGEAGALDGVWCLGDIVGYGPQPRQVLARLADVGARAVGGNHDFAAVGKISTDDFNPDAATAAEWTARQLGPDERARVESLPEVIEDDTFTMVHGTLRSPVWEYLYSYEAAAAHLERQKSPFGLVGHTHVPMLVVEGQEFPNGCEMYYLEDGRSFELPAERRLVVNPGGVGQPRDGDPRASYAVYDGEAAMITLHRVEYDIAATQRLMEEAGLPRWLIDRLAIGR
ncbi:MAG: metallophosphoesterase family protein [Chloroflexi bacterium]|nr:metallophosphoesterase family protein [Chloroflexota bacterium]